jgi:hypothetical protein
MLLHSFKTRFGSRSGQGPGHRSRGSTWVDQSEHIDKKMVTIIVLKFNSQGDPMQDWDHKSVGLTHNIF